MLPTTERVEYSIAMFSRLYEFFHDPLIPHGRFPVRATRCIIRQTEANPVWVSGTLLCGRHQVGGTPVSFVRGRRAILTPLIRRSTRIPERAENKKIVIIAPA